ncbi:carboxypeptidase-like protein [Mucilaginibacter frigoritolerans]|uniref:Carboxypeptidase-like protein n=1 Tax=Mucilaginibacter frigoritolerans TaxID=652788 RepID=A0A562TZ06_9SPHI|nr:carboxypeptidase-like regulatory domain-containing protein [Mucilaginibacter frigoritolerans]TWI98845.1 carboxypeptidase-like protein [Mucilaginibacter frigoritolerans]
MQKQYFLIFLICLTAGLASAQKTLKGTVSENGTANKLTNVFIRDNSSKQTAITDDKGNFEIKTEPGHIIIFDSPGYTSDTLYVVDLKPKNIQLEVKSIALREVSVTSSRQGQAFDPHKEYPEVYEKSKLYVLSPTTWFGKENRDARKMKKYFRTEAEQRHVDEVFTRTYVGSIVPLKGQDLDDFMTMYRPSYEFIKGNDKQSLAVYINDSYKKYQDLPPEKRHIAKLPPSKDTLSLK